MATHAAEQAATPTGHPAAPAGHPAAPAGVPILASKITAPGVPAWAVLRAGKLALRAGPRPLSGTAFLFGYLCAAAGGTRRVEDPAFRAFMRADQRRRTARVLTRGRR